jgi:hypothetical protein
MVTLPEWFVGAFFGGLITSFLWMAGLTALAKITKNARKEDKQ